MILSKRFRKLAPFPPSFLRVLLCGMLCVYVSIAAADTPASQPPAAVKRLNNLVSELASVDFGKTKSVNRVAFEMPKNGWIYVGVVRKPGATGKTTLLLDDGTSPILTLDASTALPETMRLVSAGTHTLKISSNAGGSLQSLVVRAIPQLIYFSIDNALVVKAKKEIPYATTRYYQDLWDEGILPNFNIVASEPYTDIDHSDAENKEWRAMGRQWMAKVGIAKDDAQVQEKWVKALQDPRIDGVLGDEFSSGKPKLFPFQAGVIEGFSSDPKMKGKKFYAFSGFTDHVDRYAPLADALMKTGDYMASEVYARSEAQVKATPGRMKKWLKLYPGISKNFVYFLGPDNAAAGMTFHLDPAVDYKILLQKQVAMLANDPAFANIAGVGIWAARYMDDDMLRWYARLVRHYFIEGQTTPLSTDPITLTYLQNPGFEAGEAGWEMEPAFAGSLSVSDLSIVPYTKTVYTSVPEGKKVLYTKRSGTKSNLISQTIRNLFPSRVYHLNVYTQDPNNTGQPSPIKIGIQLTGVTLFPDKSLEQDILSKVKAGSPLQGVLQPTTQDFPVAKGQNMKTTWHLSRRVFRANNTTAQLTLSDWPSDQSPTKGIGQELIWDFIDLAPDVTTEPVLPSSIFKAKQ